MLTFFEILILLKLANKQEVEENQFIRLKTDLFIINKKIWI